VLTLQPTSPLRSAADIAAALRMLELSGADSVVSVSEVPAHTHPMRMLRVDDNGHAVLFATGQPVRMRINRRQDLPKAWVMNGAVYACRTDVLFACRAEHVRRSCRRLSDAGRNDRSRLTPLKTGPRRNGPLNDSRATITTITMNTLRLAVVGTRRPLAQGKPAHVKSQNPWKLKHIATCDCWRLVHEDSRVTQRGMAKKLGIALGLANIYLKRMIHKGYIKCVNVQPNRISYLITPRGVAEKARLTYEFMDYSLHLYGEVRQHLREAMQDCAAEGKRVAIYGSGEAAELAYLSLKESGMEPVAIFDQDGGREFLGMPVRPIAEHASIEYDLMIVATLDRSGQHFADLQNVGVPREKQFPSPQGTGAGAEAGAFRKQFVHARPTASTPEASSFMALTNKRIFITGGAGFIGSHLVSQLVDTTKWWCSTTCTATRCSLRTSRGTST
jgi:hypothetical protein